MARGCFVVDAETDRVRYDANAGSINWGTGFSACGWSKSTNSDGGYRPLIWGTFTNSDFFFFGHASAANVFRVEVNGTTVDGGTAVGIGVWFFWAVSVLENNVNGVVGRIWNNKFTLLDTEAASTTGWATGHTCNHIEVGTQGDFTFSRLGKYAQVRMWDGVLSEAEFDAEMRSTVPVKTSGIINACEDNPAVDTSGNADPWDSITSIVVTDLDWPPNYGLRRPMPLYYRTMGST